MNRQSNHVPLPFAEEQLIKSFFLKQRRARYLDGLANPRKRRKMTDAFYHFRHLDLRRIVAIQPSQQNPEGIYRLLKQYGAPEHCWAISSARSLDARRMDLQEALAEIVGSGEGTFLCCIDGKLAYFEDEEDRCILHKP